MKRNAHSRCHSEIDKLKQRIALLEKQRDAALSRLFEEQGNGRALYRYRIKVMHGDNTMRWLVSEPTSHADAKRNEFELKAIGYAVEVVRV